MRIDAIYSSDLQRAADTARIIAAPHEVEVTISRELREINFGALEGRSFTEIQQDYPHISARWLCYNPGEALPEGESLNQLAARVARSLTLLEKHSPEDTVLIVAHGGTIRTILCLLLGIGLEHWWKLKVDNASFTTVDNLPWGIMLSSLNDVGHLTDLDVCT